MKKSDYIYAVASIRAQEKSLLTDADIQAMVGLKSEAAVLTYLTERGWGESGDKDMESVLSAEEDKISEIIERLGIDKTVIAVLSYDKAYHNLKTAVKLVCRGESDERAFYKLDGYEQDFLMQVIRDNEYDKLPDNMQQVAKRAKDTLLETSDGQWCDVIIDRACLDATVKDAQRCKDDFLIEYAQAKVMVTDVKIAVRAAGRDRRLLEEAIAPCDGIDAGRLIKAAAEGREAIYTYLESAGLRDCVSAIKESYSGFERWCDDYLMSKLMDQKHNIESSGPIVAYYLARSNEIRTARIIMTAKANGFPDDVILERVRRMYA